MGKLEPLYNITLISELVSVILLLVIRVYIRYRDRREGQDQYSKDKFFSLTWSANLLVAVSGAGYALLKMYPGNIPFYPAEILNLLKYLFMDFWFFLLVSYLLCKAEKAELVRKRGIFFILSAFLPLLFWALTMFSDGLYRFGETMLGEAPGNKLVAANLNFAVFLLLVEVVYTLVSIALLWKDNKSFISVFFFLSISLSYVLYVIGESVSVSLGLALTLVYAWFCVRGKRSLFQLGSILFLLFMAASVFLGRYTSGSVTRSYLDAVQYSAQWNVKLLQEEFGNYDCLPWLLHYWIDHPDEICDWLYSDSRLPAEAFLNALQKTGKVMEEEVTGEDLEKLSDREQMIFALHMYKIMTRFCYSAMNYALGDINVLVVTDPTFAMIIIDGALKKEPGTLVPMEKLIPEQPPKGPEKEYLKETISPDDAIKKDNYAYVGECDIQGMDLPVLLCVTIDSDQIDKQMNFVRNSRKQMILVLTVIGFLIIWFLYYSMLKPLLYVTRGVSMYQKDKDASKAKEWFSHIRMKNEIGILAHEFSSLTEEMEHYIKDVERMAGEKARTGTELQMAARIQTSELPDIFPAFPDRTEFDLFASMTPAREVGGDFYDFFLTDDQHLALVIADVSDKGVPAALFMMSVKNLINYRAKEGGTPAEIFESVNNQLCKKKQAAMFVTVWLGILDLTNGSLVYGNAGHENPVIRWGDGTFHIFRESHDFVIGGIAGVTFESHELKMKPGYAIFVYTDGIPEARNKEGEFYGMERLEKALNRTRGENPEGIVHIVREDVKNFVNGTDQYDDITMLCIEYKGNS